MGKLALNDNQRLDFTQDLREKLINQLAPEDKLPDDPKVLTALLATLKDYDKVTLTLKRIESDNENADADRQALLHFQKLSEMTGSKDFHRSDTPVARERPAIDPQELIPVDLVDGELKVGSDPISYENFMREQGKKHRDSLA